jgi:hypothetical protein
MQPKLKRISKLLVVVPVTATSFLASLPSEAATLASSSSSTLITSFNFPFTFSTDAVARAATIATGSGAVQATANAIAEATVFPFLGVSLSDSFASGTGFNYLGIATSQPTIEALFNVNRFFSFGFASFSELITAVDTPALEKSIASVRVGFNLFAVGDTGETLLDSFEFFGQIGSGKPTLGVITPSSNFSLFQQTALESNNNESIASALLVGQYFRRFDTPTTLRLEQFQVNEAQVKAVPTPSVLPGLLFNFILMPFMRRRKKAELAVQTVEVPVEQHQA